jgi:hypothetical protein
MQFVEIETRSGEAALRRGGRHDVHGRPASRWRDDLRSTARASRSGVLGQTARRRQAPADAASRSS